MPLERYDRYFGGRRGDANKAAKALTRKYGNEDGRKLFYAIVKKRKGQAR